MTEMTESRHAMKLRHKTEMKALLSDKRSSAHQKREQRDLLVALHSQQLSSLSSSASHPVDSLPSTSPSPSTARPLSRAQTKRDRRSQREEERRLSSARAVEGMSDPRQEENERLNALLSREKRKVEEVVSDGHCLFRSLSRQLETSRLNDPHPNHRTHRPHEELSVEELRALAAHYIRTHSEEFAPFLLDESGAPLSEDGRLAYCEALESQTEVVWGGHTEIVALSRALGRPIVVHSAEGELRVEQEESDENKQDEHPERELHISFHRHYFGLGDHYNSVVIEQIQADEFLVKEHKIRKDATTDKGVKATEQHKEEQRLSVA